LRFLIDLPADGLPQPLSPDDPDFLSRRLDGISIHDFRSELRIAKLLDGQMRRESLF
jgi:hypothetical protein